MKLKSISEYVNRTLFIPFHLDSLHYTPSVTTPEQQHLDNISTIYTYIVICLGVYHPLSHSLKTIMCNRIQNVMVDKNIYIL